MRFAPLLFLLFTLLIANTCTATGVTIKTVVIDAGHGGRDPGAIGPGKTNEKDVALAVALKLGDDIKKNFPGVNIIYTRQTDTFIELHERADIANKHKADLFIAIHCNSSPFSHFFGSSTYVLGLHRTEANLEVAKRENSVILLEGDRDKNYEFDPNSPEGNIIMTMKQNAFLDQSIDMASKIEGQFESSARRKSLGVKQAGFYVLYKTTMPSLLAEIGFVSNPDEEKYLASENGQEQIANALFKAFKEYKFEMENREGQPVTETTPPKQETIVPKPATTSETHVQPPVPVTETDNTPVKNPAPVKTAPSITAKTDSGIFVTLSGQKIRKPIETSSGGGISPANVETDNTEINTPPPVNSTTATETPTKPVKVNSNAPPVKRDNTDNNVAPVKTVTNNSPKDIPLQVKENGVVFKVQFLALKVPLKSSEHDKILKVFPVVSFQNVANGVTRYYAGDERSMAAAKKIRSEAINQGYKDAFIVGFKNGERMGPNDMKAFGN